MSSASNLITCRFYSDIAVDVMYVRNVVNACVNRTIRVFVDLKIRITF